MSPGRPLSLYVHLPFCRHKCAYCDLNAFAGLEALIPSYIAALIKEVRLIGSSIHNSVHTIYFGGGTPSITPLPLLAELFAAIRDSYFILDECEVSFEANPETLDRPYLDGLRALGVNRLSIGAQSAQPKELALFQRTHTFDDVVNAVRLARAAGFENLSLDLIYGVPGQTLVSWQDTLDRAIGLEVDHCSIYGLSLDFNTPMRAWVQRGLLAEPDDDLAAEMYERADEALMNAGYAQYEISSWAKMGDRDWGPGVGGNLQANPRPSMTHAAKISGLTPSPRFQCRHNLQYWRNQPYLGLGAGAHGYYEGRRCANVASPTAYIHRMNVGVHRRSQFSPAMSQCSHIDRRTEMNETMLTGLRLVVEGVKEEDFRARFGVGLKKAYSAELENIRRRGLVAWTGAGVRLTRAGRLVSNWVFERFV